MKARLRSMMIACAIATGCAGEPTTASDSGAPSLSSDSATPEISVVEAGPDTSTSVAVDSADVAVEDAALSLSATRTVVCGYTHVCAITFGGDLRCWGENTVGAIGDGTTVDRLAPVTVTSGVTEAAAGGQTCVRKGTDMWCWGFAAYGLLGDGVVPAPALVLVPTKIESVPVTLQMGTGAGAGGHQCALLPDAKVRCWGNDLVHQVGYPTTTICTGPTGETSPCSAVPTEVPGVSDVAEVAFGGEHTCARTQTAKDVLCWGNNHWGALGDGTTTSRWEARKVIDLPKVERLFAGLQETCALDETGSLYCWGIDGFVPPKSWAYGVKTEPVLVSGFAGKVVDVHIGGGQRCALLADGRVQCWGIGPSIPGGESDKPVTIAGLKPAISMCSSSLRSCAVENDGHIKCWGNAFLGDGVSGIGVTSSTPVEVLW